MSAKKKFLDFNSLNFRLWVSFAAFAVLLLVLIWSLQIYFLNNYYEEMKIKETNHIANEIRYIFRSNGFDMDKIKKETIKMSRNNDLTLIITGNQGEFLAVSSGNARPEQYILKQYLSSIYRLNEKLNETSFDSVTNISATQGNMRILEFACDIELPDRSNYNIYIFSPLSPVKSTIGILRSQLIYITVIAILLSFLLALFLANKISRPINKITNAAAQMGGGDYDIKFEGGSYTEIRELADTLTQAESELEKTDRYRKDMIANVSHDLRTPLTMIKSYAEMIRDLSGDNPQKREAHLGVIIDETDRLNALVTDMLNLSRMQMKTLSLDTKLFDIGKTSDFVLNSFNILKESENYKIRYNRSRGPMTVNGDEARIKQVMINLINNAVKYCGEDKEILIDMVRIGKQTVRFSVTDHGEGISPDEIAHVWERYYKSSTHHIRPTEGTGLGLNIVKEILNLHNARYNVISTVGKGSTFWFELPLAKHSKNGRKGES